MTPERRKADPNTIWTGAPGAAAIDPAAEEAYWAQNYTREPHYERGYTYADYHRGASRLGWGKNRHAARAAWQRFDPDTEPLEGAH